MTVNGTKQTILYRPDNNFIQLKPPRTSRLHQVCQINDKTPDLSKSNKLDYQFSDSFNFSQLILPQYMQKLPIKIPSPNIEWQQIPSKLTQTFNKLKSPTNQKTKIKLNKVKSNNLLFPATKFDLNDNNFNVQAQAMPLKSRGLKKSPKQTEISDGNNVKSSNKL